VKVGVGSVVYEREHGKFFCKGKVERKCNQVIWEK
jgi:hypothetical protein